MATTRLTLMQLVGKELGWASGVPTSGSTTTCLDTSSDSPMSTGDSSNLFKNAWIYISADTAGTPRNVGEARRITTYTPASQQLTHDAYAYAVATTMTYNVYCGVPPIRMNLEKPIVEYIDEVLRNMYYWDLALITLAPDGDMETSGTTSYSGTNATLAKATSGAGVTHGDQALQVTTTAANGYCTLAANLDVSEGEVYDFCVDCTPTSGIWKLQTWDVTAGAEIDVSDTYAGTQPRRLWVRSSIPADCERLNVRLIGETDATVCTFDNLSIRDTQSKRLAMPSWFTNKGWLQDVWLYPMGTQRDQAYAITERNRNRLSWRGMEESYAANTPFRLEIDEGISLPNGAHMFMQAKRPYAELSADTSSTDANQDWVKAWVLVRIYADREDKDKLGRWLAEARTLDKQWAPKIEPRYMFARPT